MKIFISIASYQDPLLEATIISAHNTASNPENLHFGVCDQSYRGIDINGLSLKSKISYELINPLLSEGPCWARKRIQQFFDKEHFYLQIDSHTQFTKNWDRYLINYMEKIQNETSGFYSAPIISCYPRAFNVIDIEKEEFKLLDDDKSTHTIAYREDSLFLNDSFSRQIGAIAKSEITQGYLLAAGFLFTIGRFVDEVPYDSDFYFYGEEMSLMLRAFTRGYGIFHIPDVPIFHLYTELSNIKRALHWDEEEDSHREIKWHDREKNSMKKLTDIIHGDVVGTYGLGKKRSLNDYISLSGIDLKKKKVINRDKALTAKYLSNHPWNISPF